MNTLKSGSIAHLRGLLQQRFPEAMLTGPRTAEEITPAARVDLLAGKLVEVVSEPGCTGAGLLLVNLLDDGGAETPRAAALVDGGDGFDPACLPAAQRQRLLWVRCRQITECVRAADLLLRDGNLDKVVLDLRLLPRRELLGLPSSVWHRLRMLAERSHACVAVFSASRTVPCAARRWVLENAFDLASMELETGMLLQRLRPRLQRGAGADPWRECPETNPEAAAIAG